MELLLNTRKRACAGETGSDFAFISTLFNTRSQLSLAHHRDDSTTGTETDKTSELPRVVEDESLPLDFRRWLAQLSTMQIAAGAREATVETPMQAIRIGIPSDQPRRKPWLKRVVWHVAALLMAIAFGISAHAGQQVTLAWNASPSPGVAGYKIHYGSTSSNYTSHINVGTNTSAVIPGLKEGQTNYFSVTAYDSNGTESAPSNEIPFYVPGVLLMSSKAKPSDKAKLQFAVAPQHWYEVQASSNLTSWTTIYQTSLSSSNGFVQYTDNQSSSAPQRYYRLLMH